MRNESQRETTVRRRLEQRRHEILGRYLHTRALAVEEQATREIEGVEQAVELWDARVLRALGEAELTALAGVEHALFRLDDGYYGRCVACRGAIEPERLDTLPETSRCLSCAVIAADARVH
jgi:RNA polymerase-binding transcription factor DksA